MNSVEYEEVLQNRTRLEALDARVAALEAALARLGGEPPAPPPFKLDDLEKTQKLVPLAAPVAGAAQAGPESRATLDRLGITASFESLDRRVAEAAEAELRLGRSNRTAGPVEIDASLIDRAFERAPPKKLDVRASLEEFHPKITQHIAAMWRTPELLQYLKRLIVDERGDRAGFSPGVMSELLLLSSVLEEPPEADTWHANARPI